MENTPKVSVIIPVYNTERYLEQCLDSLIHQTLEDFEIICIDDGSTDRSPEILNSYAKQDSRFRLIWQQNQYAGVARNRGLSVAKGEYVIFLDSDDFFAPELLEQTYAAGTEQQADIVLFAGRRYDDTAGALQEKREFLRMDLLPNQPTFSCTDISDRIFQITTPAPWSKLFRRTFLLGTGLQFQAFPNSNDYYFILSSLALAERICAVDAELVYYRTNIAQSTQSSKHTHPLCFLDAIIALYNELCQRGIYPEVEKSFLHTALSSTEYNLRTVQTDKARFQILDALMSDRFQQINALGHDESFYNYRPTFTYACCISSALEQYARCQALAKPNPVTQIYPFRAHTPVRVSVIIPVYNTEAYLDQTLQSITEQTLNEIELICVNDGSTDNSLKILQRWAERDPRISIYSKPNAGLSHTRNVGVSYATGEYLYFMDSDDILERNALEELYCKASQENLDVLYFDAISFYDEEELTEKYGSLATYYLRSKAYSQVYTGAELFTLLYNAKEYRPSACLQLIRTEHFHHYKLNFHVGILHEDNGFTFASMLKAARVSHVQKHYFHRRMRRGSIMTTTTTFRNSYGYFVSFLDMLQTYYELKENLSSEVQSCALTLIGQVLRNAQDCYRHMPFEQRGSEYGLGYDFRFYDKMVKFPALMTQRSYSAQANMAEIRTKLQQTYHEKSELNAKLQLTYREKAERGVQIKELRQQLKQLQEKNRKLDANNRKLKKKNRSLEQKNRKLKRSFSYRLGRALTWPVRKLKALFSKK